MAVTVLLTGLRWCSSCGHKRTGAYSASVIVTTSTRPTGWRVAGLVSPLLVLALASAPSAAPSQQSDRTVVTGGLAPAPPPQNIPSPAPANDQPYAPQAILPGGVVVTLFQPGSPFLKMDKVKEAEVYNMMRGVPGRVQSIVNIHNPSIEFHAADPGINTGAVVVLAAGGGHNTLNVGTEGADFVSFFYNYGVNTVILRNRLRRDGYNTQTDEVYDALQAIRMVRARAKEWHLDPGKIGIVGFSAGAELAAPAAVMFDDFDRRNSAPGDPLKGISSRPDF